MRDDRSTAAVARSIIRRAALQNRNDDDRAAGRYAQQIVARLGGAAGRVKIVVCGRFVDNGCRSSLGAGATLSLVAAFTVHKVDGSAGHDG